MLHSFGISSSCWRVHRKYKGAVRYDVNFIQLLSLSELATHTQSTLFVALNSNIMKKAWMNQGRPFKSTGMEIQ